MEDVKVIKESTCTEEGVMETKCKNCEYISEVAVEKANHDYKDDFCTVCSAHKSIEYIKFELLDDGWFASLDFVDTWEREDLPINEIYIPSLTDTGEKVVGIGNFHDLRQLKKVVVPEGIKIIGEFVFGNCTFLEEVQFLGDRSSEFTIKEAAFSGCLKLKKLELPEKCYLVGGKTFYLCKNLKTLDTLIVGGDLGESVFEGCVSLQKVKFSDSVKSVGRYTFKDCYSLKEVDLGGITKISFEMFRACSALETIVISESVTEIEGKAFYGCEKLKSVVLSKNFEKFGDFTFYACISLESINIPKSLDYIGSAIFLGCNSLKEVHFEGTKEEWNNVPDHSDLMVNSKIERIICTDGVIEA